MSSQTPSESHSGTVTSITDFGVDFFMQEGADKLTIDELVHNFSEQEQEHVRTGAPGMYMPPATNLGTFSSPYPRREPRPAITESTVDISSIIMEYILINSQLAYQGDNEFIKFVRRSLHLWTARK